MGFWRHHAELSFGLMPRALRGKGIRRPAWLREFRIVAHHQKMQRLAANERARLFDREESHALLRFRPSSPRPAKRVDDAEAVFEGHSVVHVLRPQGVAIGVRHRGGDHRVVDRETVALGQFQSGFVDVEEAVLISCAEPRSALPALSRLASARRPRFRS